MLATRLARSRKRAGFSQGQLAVAMGDRYDQTMISHVETGRSGLLGEGLAKAADVLGTSVDYLLGRTNDHRPVDILVSAAESVLDDDPHLVRIPKVASVTGGLMYRFDDTVVEQLPFPRKWLDEQKIDPKKCRLMEERSYIMEPTLPEGCTFLVDLSQLEFQSNCVYVMELQWEFRGELESALIARRVIWDQTKKDWCYTNDAGGWGTSPFKIAPTVIGRVRWVQRFL